MNSPTLRDVYKARQQIYPIANRTPLIESLPLSQHIDIPVYLKLETTQSIGAFKIRGAANKILSLSDKEKARGVVTASTGNHGRAVAYVANKIGIKAVVCISERVPETKADALRQLGAELVIIGHSQDEAEARAGELQTERGLIMVHPFDDPHIIAGQGTIALELLEDLPQVDTVLVPLSGGGLISGVALALKSADPTIQVIGLSMQEGAVMYESLKAGKPVQLPEAPTLADSLQGGIGLNNQYTFDMVKAYVDDVILISEEDIASAMAFALHEHHLVIEGAAAVGVAALQANHIKDLGQCAAVIVSGGNVDIKQLVQITLAQL